jgi:hypothetical protein
MSVLCVNILNVGAQTCRILIFCPCSELANEPVIVILYEHFLIIGCWIFSVLFYGNG